MQHRVTRLVILCLLLLAGAASGTAAWKINRGAQQLDEAHATKNATVERLLTSIAAISTAQQAYADWPRRDVAMFTQVSRQVDRLTTEAAGLRATTGADSGERLEEFWAALSTVMSAAARAREQFAAGDEAAAADTIFASARTQVTTLNSSLRAFREAEAVAYQRSRASGAWRVWTLLGTSAAVLAIGLIAFALIPLHQVTHVQAEVATTPALSLDPPVVQPAEAPEPSIDMEAAARISTDVSRLSDQASLETLLARAAEVFDARGIILWMRAGDELVAAAAHGYDASVLRRIPSIPWSAGNATAAAWRTGETGVVAEDSSGYGAIVAPMLNADGCVGVLAAEVRGGCERDATTRAVVTMLASQLGGVLAPLPGASTTPHDSQLLDRKAAS